MRDQILKLSLGIEVRIHVCNVPLLVASRFNTHTLRVHLSRQSLQHIAEKHPEVFPDDILLLPKTIRSGNLFVTPARARHLTACYPHPTVSKYWLMAGMKLAAANHELWVQTFHLAQRRHVKALEEAAERVAVKPK